MQKTPPPVLIFCENNADVDRIHEYLLLEGVEAVAFHWGKDQEKREYAIKSFKEWKKDVLVAIDVASKFLDFPDINYDVPAEIENYVHRIGQTGKCRKTRIDAFQTETYRWMMSLTARYYSTICFTVCRNRKLRA